MVSNLMDSDAGTQNFAVLFLGALVPLLEPAPAAAPVITMAPVSQPVKPPTVVVTPLPSTSSGSTPPAVAAWRQMPGAGTEIGIGANGAIWVIGTNPVAGGGGIWRWSGTDWTNMGAGAVRIDVEPQGNVSIPKDTFVGSAGQPLTLAAVAAVSDRTQSTAIPSWLRFDPVNGTLSGIPPAGAPAQLLIRVVARDSMGNNASAMVTMVNVTR